MQYKTQRIAAEWKELVRQKSLLIPVAQYFELLSLECCHQSPIVTGILRNKAEQIALLEMRNSQRIAEGLEPLSTLTPSVHEHWRGMDFRSWIYTPEQIARLVAGVNGMFVYGGRFKVLAYHPRGSAGHLHMQVPASQRWKT